MINRSEILQTIAMIDQQHLDIRTITMGISLLDCADTDIDRSCTKVYDKICRLAGNLVRTGEDIEAEFGIPIVNKRVSVTPISLVAAGTGAQSYVPYARALDRAAHEIGVNFLGGFSALVHKGMTEADRVLIASIPEALAETELVCSSVNVGSTRAGITWTPWPRWAGTVKRAAALTADQGGMACASSWSLPTPSRTTPSWPARSTVWASRSARCTSACPGRAWCSTRCRACTASRSTSWPRR